MDDGHAERPDPGTPGASAAALLVIAAVAVLVLALVAVLTLRDARRDLVRAEAEAAGIELASTLNGEVGRLGDVVRELASTVVAAGPDAIDRRSVAGFEALTFLPAEPDRVLVDRLLAEGIDVVALRPTLDRTRDGDGDVLLAPPIGTPPTSVLVEALYRTDGGQLSLRPSVSSTAARRAELAGFVVAAIDLDAVLPVDPDVRWTLTDGPVELRGRGAPLEEAVSTDIDVFGRRWTLATPVPGPGSPQAAEALVVLLGLVGIAVVAFAARQTLVTRRRHLDQVAVARRRASAIVTLSGVVQQSHDLGEILPGLSVQMSDTLGLDGLTLSVATPTGAMREIFAHGTRPDATAASRVGDLTEVAAGETLVLHLHRAERSIAVLRVVAGRGLDAGDLDLLQIAAEMIASTVVTARSSEQQQEAVARLQALDELKTAFLGTASHELRTPVTAISGFAFVLAERWDSLGDAERRVFAERIASNARALDALVQDLLDFARLERGDHAVVLEAIDLSELVRHTLERLAPVWQTHQIEQDIDAGCWVEGDRAALERVVTNLVSNAVKFSPEGGTVHVGVHHDDRVELVVDDEGPGVPPEDRDKIFIRFFRGTSQAVVRTRGVGIGLSVVEDFVLRMGGQIDVGESPAGGARFTVALAPVAAPAATDDSGPTPETMEEHDVASP